MERSRLYFEIIMLLSSLTQRKAKSWKLFFKTCVLQRLIISNFLVQTEYVENTKQIAKTENYTSKACFMNEKRKKDYIFHHIVKRLSADGKTENRKNVDQRLFWKLNDIFLVKRYFTFGLQTPVDGVAHVIETTTASMDLYYCEKWNDTYVAGKLPTAGEDLFSKQTLAPKTAYYIPNNVFYILVATQITLFSFSELSMDSDFSGMTCIFEPNPKLCYVVENFVYENIFE